MLAIAVLVALQPTSTAKQQRVLPENTAWTYVAFAWLVGHYYVTYREWPTTTEQLRVASVRMTERELPADEPRGYAKIWRSFTHVEFKPRGKDRLVIARFRSDGRNFEYHAIFHPGRSPEEIVERITAK